MRGHLKAQLARGNRSAGLAFSTLAMVHFVRAFPARLSRFRPAQDCG